MVQPRIQQNQIPNDDVDLSTLLAAHAKDVMLRFNCHHIGIIDTYYPETQRALVKIAYKRTYFKTDGIGVFRPELVDYPPVEAPVIFPRGGGFSITFPVTKGDECLVLFNDRDLSDWYSGLTQNGPVPTPRLHSFSDALVFVGIGSVGNSIVSPDSDGLALRNRLGTVKVKVKDEAVKVTAGGSDLAPAITLEILPSGKFRFTNVTGEFLAALIQILTTATAGGFPLIIDPTSIATLQSFKVT